MKDLTVKVTETTSNPANGVPSLWKEFTEWIQNDDLDIQTTRPRNNKGSFRAKFMQIYSTARDPVLLDDFPNFIACNLSY